MKSLKNYIQEKLTINSLQEKLVIKKSKYNYFPQTKKELKAIIEKRIKDEGNEVYLNDIDVSKITDMSDLFEDSLDFNGDISTWNVSNVTNMSEMFYGCKSFNKDVSGWDVSNVTDMRYMFCNCEAFNHNISSWNVSKVKDHYLIFTNCGIQEKYKPTFK